MGRAGRLYEFDRDDAIRFARERGGKTKYRGKDIVFEVCPYCKGGKNRDKGTFQLSTETGAFFCRRSSCGAKGSFLQLCRDFNFEVSADVSNYYSWKQYRQLNKTIQPEEVKPQAIQYLESRGISEAVTRRYRITAQKDREDVLVFPFYDQDGKMVFIKYRGTRKDAGAKEWCEPNCRPILFGMDQCNPANKTLVMTEGQIDSLSLAECGIENAVSVPLGKNGMTWVGHCWDWLQQFETLIVFGDFEHGAITLYEPMKTRFRGIVKHVRPEDYKGCKDANELLQKCGKDAVRQAVANAETERSPQLVLLGTVDAYNPRAESECVKTGFERFDKEIGGLRFGQLVLLTGECGDGKSTLGSQFICQALCQGYPSMIYSGEMSKKLVQYWIDRQLSAGRGLSSFTTETGKEEWEIAKWKADNLHRWYMADPHKLFIYDSKNFLDDPETEAKSLPEVMEEAAKLHEVRFFLADNLMTATDESESGYDLNVVQTNIVKRLAAIAYTYNAIVILVCHPRKDSGGAQMTKDGISGSMNITNQAGLLVQYTKPPADPAGIRTAPRWLRVLKNRLTEDLLDKDGIPLWYDKATKRISDCSEDFSWKTDEQMVVQMCTMDAAYDETLPF